MGSGEGSTPTKPPSKTKAPATPAAQETPPMTPSVYPDWAASPAQALYGGGAVAGTPPAFFSPPSPSPYMWGSQHLISPYGTPLPYPAMYHPSAMYGHPMALAQGTTFAATETEGRPVDGISRSSTKKSKNAGPVVGKSGDGGKATSGSANDDPSQSGDSGSDSSNARDEETSPQDISDSGKRSYEQAFSDVSVHGKAAGTVPATNLNIGMDLWNASHAGAQPMKGRPNAMSISPAVGPLTGAGMNGVAPENHWVQDEREIKKQRRKLSNRESARRSRMRKQQECEDLAKKVDELNAENNTLRSEIDLINVDCKKLESENASIMEELTRLYGHEAVAAFVNDNVSLPVRPVNTESNGHQSPRGSNLTSSESNGRFSTSNGKVQSDYK